MAEQVVIDRRFRGPPASANGGYASGILAARLEGGAAEVNLRRPPPLDRPLHVDRDGEQVRLLDADELVADGRALDGLETDLPAPPSIDEAREAGRRRGYWPDHPFNGCFVCGPDRQPGDGLCLYPTQLDGRDVLACTWIPTPDLAAGSGEVATEIVWGALDCPGGIAAHEFADGDPTMVLARLRGRVITPVRADEEYVVTGWMTGRDGRKAYAGTAIFDAAGEPAAFSEALWIELRDEAG